MSIRSRTRIISNGKTSVISRGIPLGKQLATVGSIWTSPLVFLCAGSSFLLAFHFASAQPWKEGSSLGLKVAADSVIFAQTPFRFGTDAGVCIFFAPDCAAV